MINHPVYYDARVRMCSDLMRVRMGFQELQRDEVFFLAIHFCCWPPQLLPALFSAGRTAPDTKPDRL